MTKLSMIAVLAALASCRAPPGPAPAIERDGIGNGKGDIYRVVIDDALGGSPDTRRPRE